MIEKLKPIVVCFNGKGIQQLFIQFSYRAGRELSANDSSIDSIQRGYKIFPVICGLWKIRECSKFLYLLVV